MSPEEKDVLAEILLANYGRLRYLGGIQDGFATVDVEPGDNRRWTRYVAVITQGPSGAYYRWGFEEPLTELGDWELGDELVEVTRHEELAPRVFWKEVE